jgi:5'-3' exonuclease
MYSHMLIDGRNAAYRAVYAGLGDIEFMRSGADFSVVFFRFIGKYVRQFQPQNVHFFWDAPKEELWRRKIAPDYKDGREHEHKEKIERVQTVCRELIECLNGRNYYQDRQEADDLVYAFCRMHRTDRLLIISSDKDFRQIPHMYCNVDLWSPMSKDGQIHKVEALDPVEVKCFMGEKGDNIRGYMKIGEVNATRLATNPKQREEFFTVRSEETYRRNRALVDLTLCPFTLQNIRHIQTVLAKDLCYDAKKIIQIAQKYRVRGLTGEINRVLFPFKFLGAQSPAAKPEEVAVPGEVT